jgi:urease beta subunit
VYKNGVPYFINIQMHLFFGHIQTVPTTCKLRISTAGPCKVVAIRQTHQMMMNIGSGLQVASIASGARAQTLDWIKVRFETGAKRAVVLVKNRGLWERNVPQMI